ncbi:MAG: class II aldolase/adducin family protein, partial [Terriglobia bacterium]
MAVGMAGPSKRSRESRPQSGDIVHALCQTGRQFYDRGWVLGASGNFSAIVSRIPLRLAITA